MLHYLHEARVLQLLLLSEESSRHVRALVAYPGSELSGTGGTCRIVRAGRGRVLHVGSSCGRIVRIRLEEGLSCSRLALLRCLGVSK